jgi:putative membrane protein insertion efficiency factor
LIARFLILLIRVYQRTLSPLLGNVCRFEPSCSRYAAACLATHGALRGTLLSVVRVCKCNPFHPGGFDPPPPALGRAPSGPQAGRADGGSSTDRAPEPGR